MHMKRGGRKQVINAIACCFQAIFLRELTGEVQYSTQILYLQIQ